MDVESSADVESPIDVESLVEVERCSASLCILVLSLVFMLGFES